MAEYDLIIRNGDVDCQAHDLNLGGAKHSGLVVDVFIPAWGEWGVDGLGEAPDMHLQGWR